MVLLASIAPLSSVSKLQLIVGKLLNACDMVAVYTKAHCSMPHGSKYLQMASIEVEQVASTADSTSAPYAAQNKQQTLHSEHRALQFMSPDSVSSSILHASGTYGQQDDLGIAVTHLTGTMWGQALSTTVARRL
jgi:hypothetical protein